MYYSVSCVLLRPLCNTRLYDNSVSGVLLRQLCIFGQLCITRSVNVYTDRLSQLCITPSVVSVILGQLCSTRLFVHYSVGCVVLRQLGSTRSIVYTRLVVYYSAY